MSQGESVWWFRTEMCCEDVMGWVMGCGHLERLSGRVSAPGGEEPDGASRGG